MTQIMNPTATSFVPKSTATRVIVPTTSACDRVFNIAELAEQILLQLEPKDILCGAQRTCRLWHINVQASRAIQELLFFRPVSENAVFLVQDEQDTDRDAKSRLLFRNHWAYLDQPDVERHVIENPWLYKLSDERDLSPAMARPEASWRRMLVTQPPMTHLITSEGEDWKGADVVRAGDPVKALSPKAQVAQKTASNFRGARYLTMGYLAMARPYYAVRGSALWEELVGGWEQIKRLKRTERVEERFLEILVGEQWTRPLLKPKEAIALRDFEDSRRRRRCG